MNARKTKNYVGTTQYVKTTKGRITAHAFSTINQTSQEKVALVSTFSYQYPINYLLQGLIIFLMRGCLQGPLIYQN